MEIAYIFASVAIGVSITLWRELYTARAELKTCLKEFDTIAKAASTANQSMADKLLTMSDKLETLDFRTANLMTSQPQPIQHWNKK